MGQATVEFDALYQHYRTHVESFVWRRIDGPSVEDVVSDVFAAAWRRREDLPSNALPWLYATARNCIGTRYRSQERWQMLATKLSQVPAERYGRDPADILTERQRVTAALESLGEEDRELVLLTAWEGMTVSEVGEALGISTGNTSVRLHRARKKLRTTLTEPNELSRTDAPSPGEESATTKEHDNG